MSKWLPLIVLSAFSHGCCASDTLEQADKYELLKHHFFLHEWTIAVEAQANCYVMVNGPEFEKHLYLGVQLEPGEHIFWVQRDLDVGDRLNFHFPPITSSSFENPFGTSFRVVRPEGLIQETGSIKLLESYDSKTYVYLYIDPQ